MNAFATGDIIGNYRLGHLLGKGGMGAVYEAVHTRTGERVALKVFTCNGTKRDFLRKRFLAEGRLLMHLAMPGLVAVRELGIDEATLTPYFAMDPVLDADGKPCTLEDYRKRDGFDERSVGRIYAKLRDILSRLHERGVVHRDVKLENVLVDAEGCVSLADLGVSRIFDENLRSAVPVTTTMVGDGAPVMGSAGYLAPELRRGEKATPASDAWALGVAVFRLLTGVWYEPDSSADDLLAGFDPGWRDVLRKLLSPDPKRRLPIPELRVASGRARRICRAAIGLAVVLAVLFGAWLFAGRRQGNEDATATQADVSVKKADFLIEADGSAYLALPGIGEMKFVQCPPGPVDLVIGKSSDMTRRVEITEPYWISETPVTHLQASFYPPLSIPKESPSSGKFDSYVCLNHFQVEELVRMLNEMLEGRLPNGCVVRLATLAEWEMAYHAGAKDESDPHFDLIAVHQGDAVDKAVSYNPGKNDPVRVKPPNAWGIWDWCAEEHVADTFDPETLVAPDRAKHPDYFLVNRLPEPPSLTNPVWRCNAPGSVGTIRMPFWALWKGVSRQYGEDWAPFRLVVGRRPEGNGTK